MAMELIDAWEQAELLTELGALHAQVAMLRRWARERWRQNRPIDPQELLAMLEDFRMYSEEE
jgi:hypothetical protein